MGRDPRNGERMDFYTLFYIEKRQNQETCCNMHWGAIIDEAELSNGGILCAFTDTVTLQIKPAVRCCKCIYWWYKQEISHTTIYPHLQTLAEPESLSCEYFKALNVGYNATYTCTCTSPQIVEILDNLVNEIYCEC